MTHYSIEESPLSHFFVASTKSSWLWLIIRVYVGWEWFIAGYEKVVNPVWSGASAGKALTGFVNNALTKTGGLHPDVQSWYAVFLENVVAPYPVFWSNLVAWGELLTGIALLLGFLTGIAAFLGIFMNVNYLLAGTVSTNPILLLLGIGLIIAWRVAGFFGLDFYILPRLHWTIRPRNLR